MQQLTHRQSTTTFHMNYVNVLECKFICPRVTIILLFYSHPNTRVCLYRYVWIYVCVCVCIAFLCSTMRRPCGNALILAQHVQRYGGTVILVPMHTNILVSMHAHSPTYTHTHTNTYRTFHHHLSQFRAYLMATGLFDTDMRTSAEHTSKECIA